MPLIETISKRGANDESQGIQDHKNRTRGTGKRAGKPPRETIPERGANDESEGIQDHKNCTRGTGRRARKPQNETDPRVAQRGIAVMFLRRMLAKEVHIRVVHEERLQFSSGG